MSAISYKNMEGHVFILHDYSLDLFCKKTGKCLKIFSLQAFFGLYCQCKLDSDVMAFMNKMEPPHLGDFVSLELPADWADNQITQMFRIQAKRHLYSFLLKVLSRC